MKSFTSLLTGLLCFNLVALALPINNTLVTSAESSVTASTVVENLNRGVSAINTDDGMLVSWRFLANDPDDAIFKLYRNDTLIYTSNVDEATCFIDASGTSSDTYRVDMLQNDVVKTSDVCTLSSANDYLQINLDPPTSSNCTYSPNDCTTGDVDGDGEYEIFLKWDPSTSKDNSQSGKTDKVYIDCLKMDGTRLWRIDLGYNIRAGAHYTQMLVADFDSDGSAELICKTADGTIDGLGNTIGDASAVYRNSKGYILTGAEYLTLFDGATGEALDTIDYNPQRGSVSSWGDKYGNRVDRFLGSVAYLDSDHPSAVTVRGYYTRMTACAYDVIDKKLVKRWYFDTNDNENSIAFGDGNHNCMPADVDGDGKQEIVLGATCLDDDGSLLWCNNTGHGDALHVGDFLPERDGLEVWICHEDKPYGVSLLDAKTGKTIFHYNGDTDTGRCCADNVWSGNDGAEFWGLNNNVYNGSGTLLSCRRPAINFLSYWDGDLEREILDGYTDTSASISKMKEDGTLTTLLTTDGYYTCNTTKGTPCLSADLFGDWREELIVRASDSKSIRIYCTTYDTDYRITTLMQDPQYRNQVAGQNIAYNQPPHASFYLGSDEALPSRPNVVTLSNANDTLKGATLVENGVYSIQNVNSQLYMNTDANNNVQQSNDITLFRAVPCGSGYYYLYALVGDQISYCLTLDGSTEQGANIIVDKASNGDNQKFKFIINDDGSYTIRTKSSNDLNCIEIIYGGVDIGNNVQQWEVNGFNCQDWILTQTTEPGYVMDTTKIYMFKNSNSKLFMEVNGGTKEDGTNIQQWGADGSASHNSWSLQSAGNGYYYIYSQLGDGKTYYLDIADGKSSNGTNVQIWTENKTSSQLFKFIHNLDGTFSIVTKASKDVCALEVQNGSTSSGGNVQQGTFTGVSYQTWIIDSVGTIEDINIIGDINIDGNVNYLDIILLKKHLLMGTSLEEQQLINADCNQDTLINIMDLSKLKNIILY